MTDPLLSPEEAIAAAVRVVDEGIEYGSMGIDAPPEVGRRAAELLAPAVERHADDLRLRCVYSAALSLAGRLSDAREQLGKILGNDPAYFEAVAELDHPSAWRHVFLAPPWSPRATRLAPLMRSWVHPGGELRFASLREGADRVVSLLAVPLDPTVAPALASAPLALDVTLLTRTTGPFLALHIALGGPEPDAVRLVDGFEFPWPEGTGFRSELLMRFFLQQDRTYVILGRPDGSVAVNRLVRLGDDDRERHERFLRRLEAASPRDTDTRLQQATISRYREEFSVEALRVRLVYRLKQGHAPPEQVAEEEPPRRAVPETAGRDTMRAIPSATPELGDTPPLGEEMADASRPPATAGETPSTAPAPPPEPVAPDEIAARSALAVAGLWPWVRRERLLGHGIPVLLGAAALVGAAVIRALGPTSSLRLAAGTLLGLAAGILVAGAAAARLEGSLRRHIDRLVVSSEGRVTLESLAEAARTRGSDVLGGRWGERLRRRLLRMLVRNNPSPRD